MKIYETKAALRIIYYLIAIDGAIGEDELSRFYEIGEELDRKNFDSYKDELVEACRKCIDSVGAHDDDYYDVIQEDADAALRREADDDDRGLTPRLLLWNLFAVAFSNNEYDASEKRFIAHMARVAEVEKSVVLEMEQLVKTAISVQREMTWLQESDRPYAEVRPLVNELEQRLQVITDAAKALVEDEVVLDAPYEEKLDFLDKAKGAIDETMTPVLQAVGDTAKAAGKKAKDAGGAVFSAVRKGLLGKTKKGASAKEEEDE